MSEEVDWKKKYEDLRASFLQILQQIDNEGFGLQSVAKNLSSQIQQGNIPVTSQQQSPLTRKPNRALRRKLERDAKI